MRAQFFALAFFFAVAACSWESSKITCSYFSYKSSSNGVRGRRKDSDVLVDPAAERQETEAFRAAVTSTAAAIFQKSTSNPQQIMAQKRLATDSPRATPTAAASSASSSSSPATVASTATTVTSSGGGAQRYSPMRSYSLKLPGSGGSAGGGGGDTDDADGSGADGGPDLRKRSCPGPQPSVESIPEHGAWLKKPDAAANVGLVCKYMLLILKYTIRTVQFVYR